MFDRAKKIYEYAEPNLTIVALMGIVGFPAYFYIWQFLVPSGYENLWLRLACGALLIPILLRHKIPYAFKRQLHVYYIIALGVCLPFFFFFMLLKNDWSVIWVMSLMSAIFLQILLIYDSKIVALQSIIAFVSAYAAVYIAGGNNELYALDWNYIPILVFTYVFGTLFHYRNHAEHEQRVSLAKSFGAGIAHEMRNPLSAVYSSIEVVKFLLPERNAQHLSDQYHLDAKDLDEINLILDDSMSVIEKGNETISLLLTSIDEHKLSTASFKRYSLGETLEASINSFHYADKSDRSMIHLEFSKSDEFFGSDVLVRYVIFNLLKNAFYYKFKANFYLNIQLNVDDEEWNVISVEDSGPGMDPEAREHIFDDFYTSGKKGGFGLGLPFCRKVMKALNGKITCESAPGKGTKFSLYFPKYHSEIVLNAKSELIRSKALIYIGYKNATLNALQSHAFFSGYQLRAFSDDFKLNSFELTEDVVLIDLSIFKDDIAEFSALERKLCNYEGKIVYLYAGNILDCFKLNRILPYELMEISTFGQNLAVKLDKLFFENSQQTPQSNAKPKTSPIQPTVLIVDDNASLRIYSSTLLERQGYKVLQAENGKTALQVLKSNSINLILMDLEMPEMDGIETTKAIREINYECNGKEIPIVCFTGEKCEQTLKAISESGMNDYILKPASKDILINKVATWV